MKLAVCCLVLVWAGCSSHQQPAASASDTEKDRLALAKLHADFVAAYSANDAAAIANLYSADAVLTPEGDPTSVGRAAIQQYFKSGFEQVTMKATLTSQEFSFMGADWAYERGTYAITTTPKTGGNPSTQEYRYLTLVHREPDGWKVKRDTYNVGKP